MKRWVTVAAILTIATSLFVFYQSLLDTPSVRLGVHSQWTWKYDHSPFADRAMFGLAAAGLLGWLCYRTRDHVFELVGGRLVSFLMAAVALCFVLQASFAYLSRAGFGQGVFWMGTPKVNAEFDEARKADSLRELMIRAQDPERPFRIHVSTHPPGAVAFYLVQRFVWGTYPDAAAQFVAMVETILPYAAESRQELFETLKEPELATLYSSMVLLWLAIALGVVPLYFWTRDFFDPPTAVISVGLYGLIPSLLLFSPRTDQLYVPLAIAMVAQFHLGLGRRDPAQLVFAGILSWLALQFTLAFLVILFLVAVQVGVEFVVERRAVPTLKLLAWAAGGFIAPVGLCLPAGYNSLLVWKLCLEHNAQFNLGRTYWAWVVYNPLDFVLFLGIPIALFFLKGMLDSIAQRAKDDPSRFGLAFLITLALLNISGINRGEVARLWMFLMPMAAAVAAYAMRDDSGERAHTFPVCFGLLFVQSVLFKLSLDLLLPAVD